MLIYIDYDIFMKQIPHGGRVQPAAAILQDAAKGESAVPRKCSRYVSNIDSGRVRLSIAEIMVSLYTKNPYGAYFRRCHRGSVQWLQCPFTGYQ